MADHTRELVLTNKPVPWRAWWADLRAHRQVLLMLARKDFQTRYKRTSLGVLWAVAVPVIQGVVMVFIFSQVVRVGQGPGFAVFVLSGTLGWSFFSSTIGVATTAIVDGSGLTEKVWFPRAILVAVPPLANVVGLVVSMGVLVCALPFLEPGIHLHTLLLVPACLLLITFTLALALVLSALDVFFRDVKFIVQAALVVWLYVTPIIYPRHLLGKWVVLIDLNPMTGVVTVFHTAALGTGEVAWRPIVIAIAATVGLAAVGLVAHHRLDRLFVDRL